MSVKLLNEPRVRAEFQIGMDAGAAGYVSKIAMPTSTPNDPSGRYGFFGAPPKPQQRDGSLAVTSAVGRRIGIDNQIWEAAVDIPEEDVDRDQTNGWNPYVRGLGEGFGMYHFEHFMKLLAAGTGTTYGTCYDGVSFLNTAHVLGKATNNNLLTATEVPSLATGTAAAPTPEELIMDMVGAAGQMRAFKNEQNSLFNWSAKKFLVILPTSMWASGVAATYANNLAGSVTNVIMGMKAGGYEFDVVDWPLLTAQDAFYVVRTDGVSARPFIHQTEKQLRIRTLDADSDYSVATGKLLVKADWRGGYGYGEPLHVAKATRS